MRVQMSTGFLDEFAAELGAGTLPVPPPLSAIEAETVLELARLVAHGTERRNAPLASYLTGLAVAGMTADGAPREEALDRALDVARRLLETEPRTS
ncbi:MAG: hypothetical protein QOK05_418 [Chloroflexota bacterium]|jgi:hypothetical protein|nr:hypothetical protein [Chloroflexota bacterium]